MKTNNLIKLVIPAFIFCNSVTNTYAGQIPFSKSKTFNKKVHFNGTLSIMCPKKLKDKKGKWHNVKRCERWEKFEPRPFRKSERKTEVFKTGKYVDVGVKKIKIWRKGNKNRSVWVNYTGNHTVMYYNSKVYKLNHLLNSLEIDKKRIMRKKR